MSLTASVFAVLLERHRICLFSGGGLKYSGSIYKQQTQTELFMNIKHTPPFHSLFAHYEISCSLRQFQMKKKKNWYRAKYARFEAKICSEASHAEWIYIRAVMQVLIYEPCDWFLQVILSQGPVELSRNSWRTIWWRYHLLTALDNCHVCHLVFFCSAVILFLFI